MCASGHVLGELLRKFYTIIFLRKPRPGGICDSYGLHRSVWSFRTERFWSRTSSQNNLWLKDAYRVKSVSVTVRDGRSWEGVGGRGESGAHTRRVSRFLPFQPISRPRFRRRRSGRSRPILGRSGRDLGPADRGRDRARLRGGGGG